MSRRGRLRRRHVAHDYPENPIDVRVGSNRADDLYLYLRLRSLDDAGRFESLIQHVVASNPQEPLLIAVSGYQPWLEEVFESCLDSLWSERDDVVRETVQFDTLRFPEHTTHRSNRKIPLPWTFVMDHLNVPDVYFWSFREKPPYHGDNPNIDLYTLRMGVWTCTRGAYVRDRSVPVTMIFFQQNIVTDHITKNLLFPYMFEDEFYNVDRGEDENITYIFLRLFELLTDWENIVREFEGHLDASEKNSRELNLPVKQRTRTMHHQIERIYELQSYLRFHTRCIQKLGKLIPSTFDGRSQSGKDQDETDPVWNELDDISDEVQQASDELNSLKERFSNLTDLEFNIENAKQSDDSRFLSAIATLFLPVSFLASVWGFTNIDVTPIQYVYVAVPVLIISGLFVLLFPATLHFVQRLLYPEEKIRLEMRPKDYTMLGHELPGTIGAPKRAKTGRSRRGHSISRQNTRRMSEKEDSQNS